MSDNGTVELKVRIRKPIVDLLEHTSNRLEGRVLEELLDDALMASKLIEVWNRIARIDLGRDGDVEWSQPPPTRTPTKQKPKE